MMKLKLIPILLMAVLLSFGIVSLLVAGKQSNSEVEKLKWIESANPEKDAKGAIKRKDFRLRAIYGYTIEIPGVDQKDYDKVKQKYGISPIEGTSDSIVSTEHARLKRLASEYAFKYNMVILTHWNK